MGEFVLPIDILLVEDNPGDARLAREALRDSKVRNNMHWVDNGMVALDFLYHEGEYRDTPNIDLVLLDLNLPGLDGREVLKRVKEDARTKHIPVVILTTSQAEEDVLRSYSYHANCYITKPIDLDQFVKVVESIEDFWLSIVKLPKKE